MNELFVLDRNTSYHVSVYKQIIIDKKVKSKKRNIENIYDYNKKKKEQMNQISALNNPQKLSCR